MLPIIIINLIAIILCSLALIFNLRMYVETKKESHLSLVFVMGMFVLMNSIFFTLNLVDYLG